MQELQSYTRQTGTVHRRKNSQTVYPFLNLLYEGIGHGPTTDQSWIQHIG